MEDPTSIFGKTTESDAAIPSYFDFHVNEYFQKYSCFYKRFEAYIKQVNLLKYQNVTLW